MLVTAFWLFSAHNPQHTVNGVRFADQLKVMGDRVALQPVLLGGVWRLMSAWRCG